MLILVVFKNPKKKLMILRRDSFNLWVNRKPQDFFGVYLGAPDTLGIFLTLENLNWICHLKVLRYCILDDAQCIYAKLVEVWTIFQKPYPYTLGQKFTFYPKIHTLKIPIFTKFTFLKSHISQNSQFWNLNSPKIHLSEISFFTKFTIL